MKNGINYLFAAVLLVVGVGAAHANDGVYYVNGSQLVPVNETDVAVTKEVLTISLCDDGYAKVDVQYEFMNRGAAKKVEMGFEANAPYNVDTTVDMKGGHPFIHDFTATMNGERMDYRNAVVLTSFKGTDFVPVDLERYDPKKSEISSCLYDNKTGEMEPFSYAYYFTAHFKEGLNTIHHTYRYRMSMGVGRTFEVPYWLKPALRWANRQIDDFTLRIKAENTAKHFCLPDSLFGAVPFKVTEGKGKIRKNNFGYGTTYIEIALRNATVEWHAQNFKPIDDLVISSADTYTGFNKRYPLGYFYDRSETFHPDFSFESIDKRILRNMPYANRGYVFKDRKLNRYFSKFWSYMPDPNWKPSDKDFTPYEQKLLKEAK